MSCFNGHFNWISKTYFYLTQTLGMGKIDNETSRPWFIHFVYTSFIIQNGFLLFFCCQYHAIWSCTKKTNILVNVVKISSFYFPRNLSNPQCLKQATRIIHLLVYPLLIVSHKSNALFGTITKDAYPPDDVVQTPNWHCIIKQANSTQMNLEAGRFNSGVSVMDT